MRPSFSDLIAQVKHRLYDFVAMHGHTGFVREAVIGEFIKEAMRYYSKQEVMQWLDSVGLRPQTGGTAAPRVGAKTRVPRGDGTYVLDGVVFGEPKREELVDFSAASTVRGVDKQLEDLKTKTAVLSEKLLQ